VRIALRRGIVLIPCSSREALLERFRNLDSLNDVRDAFLAVGTTQPVRLTDPQKALLLNIITLWADQTDGGYGDLPEGIYDLRNALHDDLSVRLVRPASGHPCDRERPAGGARRAWGNAAPPTVRFISDQLIVRRENLAGSARGMSARHLTTTSARKAARCRGRTATRPAPATPRLEVRRTAPRTSHPRSRHSRVSVRAVSARGRATHRVGGVWRRQACEVSAGISRGRFTQIKDRSPASLSARFAR
jgi:hypothetical protein